MRTWATTALASTLAGCSLLVSTDGLHGGGEPSAPPSDSGAPIVPPAPEDASTPIDAGTDSATTDTSGLIGAWLFEDGTANDSSGKANHGVLLGNAVVGATSRGNSLVLTGNGYMQVSTLAAKAFPPNGTLSLWVRWTEIDKAETQLLFDGWDPSRRHMFLRHADNAPVGEFQFALQNRASNYVAEGYAATSIDVWTHLVVTWDTTRHATALYQNGGLVSRDPIDGDFLPDEEEITIGRYLHGAIDDVRLFDRALTDPEALALP